MATEDYPTYPDLAGKVAVVSGGSRGIGAATCRLLTQNGAKVAVNGRDEVAIDSVVQEIRGSEGEAIGVAADLTDFSAVERMRGRVEEELGPVEVLAAFAGGQGYPTPTEQMSEEQWRSVIDSDLTATIPHGEELPAGHDRTRARLDRHHGFQRGAASLPGFGGLRSSQSGGGDVLKACGQRGRPARRAGQLLGPILYSHRASEAPDAGGNPATGSGDAPAGADGDARGRSAGHAVSGLC
jgi:NAD(P)-dependent dehydrogenase (short-subunit alcohol dehydrogenase family)